jgi:hypothetical protein
MFDTDKNGLVDAIEVFSCIIMFSDSKAEDKIRFLFDNIGNVTSAKNIAD